MRVVGQSLGASQTPYDSYESGIAGQSIAARAVLGTFSVPAALAWISQRELAYAVFAW